MSFERDNRSVSLEELLRIKRAERPSAEFWAKWEKELRTKQLAAILDKRPWWYDVLPRFIHTLARYQRPVGASAVLALTFLGVYEYQMFDAGKKESAAMDVAAHSGVLADALDESANGVLAELRQPGGRSGVQDNEAAAARQDEASSRQSSLLSATANNDGVGAKLRFAEHGIAANLAIARAVDPKLMRVLKPVADNEALAVRAQMEEPLAKVVVSGDSHPTHLQAYATLASYASSTVSGQSRYQERQVSRLSEDQFYESAVSRISARGDRVLLRF